MYARLLLIVILSLFPLAWSQETGFPIVLGPPGTMIAPGGEYSREQGGVRIGYHAGRRECNAGSDSDGYKNSACPVPLFIFIFRGFQM